MQQDQMSRGVEAKALRLGLSVEVKRRALTVAAPLYRFSNHGRVLTRWLTLALAHGWLDTRERALAPKGDRT